MTKLITLDELEYIVKSCKRNKSPGLDGLSYEFYQATFAIIGSDLLEVYLSQLAKKVLIPSKG